MKAVIMAGGEGTRLRPITEAIPKPLVPIGGKACMSYILELLNKHGVNKAIVTLCYLGDKIKDYYGSSCCGVDLEYFTEEKPLGTAGSVKSIINQLDDTFLVVSGDALCEIDLSSAIKFHQEKNADITMVLKKVEDPSQYGVAICNADGRIERFCEKPKGKTFSNTVNTGIYIINKYVFDLVPEGTKYDFSKDLFPKILSLNMGLYGFAVNEYWCDVGSLDVFLKSNLKYSGKGSYSGSVMGKDCNISKNAEVINSVIFDNVSIGNNSSVESSVVCSNVVIDDGVHIPKGCVIKQGERVGKDYDFGSCINSSLYSVSSNTDL